MSIPEFRTQHQLRINEFMRLAGQELPDKPCVPSFEVRKLRARLILEEALETIHALGFQVLDGMHIAPSGEPNLIEIIDGCCDVSVVTIGTLSACGIPDGVFLNEVDQSNLRKFGPGGRRREDGKWLKSSDWVPPDIAGILERISQ
jgi:predicted HAD superfamily Cof-like phosphohydrolase